MAQDDYLARLKLKAASGDAVAQHKLGWVYEGGLPQNYTEAFSWYYKEILEEYDADIQNSLTDIYYEGPGMSPDYIEAVKEFQQASIIPTCHSPKDELGLIHANGKDVAQNW